MISIIIPAYNSAATIVEALESVAAQTLWASLNQEEKNNSEQKETKERKGGGLVSASGGDNNTSLFPSFPSVQNPPPLYEVIVVDDCSTDNTVEVVQNWITSHSSLPTSHVLRFTLNALPANGGPAVARNKGIQEAHGEWIAFLDADDIWLSRKLELQMHLATEHPEVVLWCGETIGFAGAPVNSDSLLGHSTHNQEPITNKNFKPLTLEALALRNYIATSTVMIRKAVLEEVGGFDPQFRGPEDYDLWLRVAARIPPEASIMRIAEPLTQYRQTAGSLSLDDRKFLPQVFKVLDKAYGSGGALERLQHFKKGSFSRQYWCGAWMAYSRGDRLAAIRLWWKAWRLNRKATPYVERPWYRMLIRYSCLSKPL